MYIHKYYQIQNILNEEEKKMKPCIQEMFTDVYDDIPQNLQQQQISIKQHLLQYGESYPELCKYENTHDFLHK